MKRTYKIRRTAAALIVLIIAVAGILTHPDFYQPTLNQQPAEVNSPTGDAATALNGLPIKGRAPKTNYSRDQFGGGWDMKQGCDTRNAILRRDLVNAVVDIECKVISGTLNDPYTGKVIEFRRGEFSSDDVQIDHVVALSDAWQKGAQRLTATERLAFANDSLNLLAVDGSANQQKSDGDAAAWLPPNKTYRCRYVARQIAVKLKYTFWITQTEHDAMKRILDICPGQILPQVTI